MKKVAFIAVVFIAFNFVFPTKGYAQSTLPQVPSPEKEKLREIAVEIAKKYAPEYYDCFLKSNMEPVFLGPLKYVDPEDRSRPYPAVNPKKQSFYMKRQSEYYVVIFPYDSTKYYLDWSFAAEVYIWKKNRTPISITAGSGYGLVIELIPKTRGGEEEESILPFYEAERPKELDLNGH